MAEHYPKSQANNTTVVPPLAAAETTTDHGCFDFMIRKSKDEKAGDVVMTDVNTSGKRIAEDGKHNSLRDELQRTNTNSGSSSDEEVEEGGDRKKKKMGLTETIKEKLSGEENKHDVEDGKIGETVHPAGEKKGLLEKIKEKLPGQDKNGCSNVEINTTQTPPIATHEHYGPENEKKGIIDKIKEKLPGHQKHNECLEYSKKED